jgi:hypothetical protein
MLLPTCGSDRLQQSALAPAEFVGDFFGREANQVQASCVRWAWFHLFPQQVAISDNDRQLVY